jgi:hypothetical protein
MTRVFQMETWVDADVIRAGCLLIGLIDLNPKGTGIVLPPTVHLVAGFSQIIAPYMSG